MLHIISGNYKLKCDTTTCLLKIAKIQNTDNTKCDEYMEQQELTILAGGNKKCTATLEVSLVVFYLFYKKQKTNK